MENPPSYAEYYERQTSSTTESVSAAEESGAGSQPSITESTQIESAATAAEQLNGELTTNAMGDAEYRSPEQVGGCFVAGTLVHTRDGLVPIEKIRVGDWVLSQPEMKGEQAYKRVTNTFVFDDKDVSVS